MEALSLQLVRTSTCSLCITLGILLIILQALELFGILLRSSSIALFERFF